MNNLMIEHLQTFYGLNPNIPHPAFQFPRLPPGTNGSMFKVNEIPTKKQFFQNTATMNQKLQEFHHTFQQYAAGLITMNSTIIPPGHPLYTRQNSVETLKAENDKLLKENSELKKKLESKSE